MQTTEALNMAEAPEIFDIVVKSYTGKKLEVKVTALDTVQKLKGIVGKSLNIPGSECVLVFKEQELRDHVMLGDAGIKNGSNLFLAVRMNGGPLYTTKVYGSGVKNLKNLLERTKQSLGNKYSNGCRVLVLVYKDEEENHQLVKVYDENDHAKACQEEEFEPQNEMTHPSEMDRVKVLKRLYEEVELKLKVLDLKRKMKEVAEQKKMRKNKEEHVESVEIAEDTQTKVVSSPYRLPLSESIFHRIILQYNGEFSYTDFMKLYYDESRYNREMMADHLTFRIVETVTSKTMNPSQLILPSEKSVLKEENRRRDHQIAIMPRMDKRAFRLGEYEHRKRQQMETVAFEMRRVGFTIPQVDNYIRNVFSDGFRKELFECEPEPNLASIEDLRTCVSQMNLDGCRPQEMGARQSLACSGSSTPAVPPHEESVSPKEATSAEEEEEEVVVEEESEEGSSWMDSSYTESSSAEDSVVVETDEDLDSSSQWTDIDDRETPERSVTIRDLPPVVVRKTSKCSVCKRRLNVVNRFDCRCGKINCSQHRYAESHGCKIDYRKKGRDTLTKQNPRIDGEKLKKL